VQATEADRSTAAAILTPPELRIGSYRTLAGMTEFGRAEKNASGNRDSTAAPNRWVRKD
jgi:hypothetical protein